MRAKYKEKISDAETTPETPQSKVKKSKEKKSKEKKSNIFRPPSVDEVAAYCRERKNNVDPQRFVDFYAAKGWMVGKNKMKDWKAAVRTWERRDSEKNTQDFAKKYDYDGDDTL